MRTAPRLALAGAGTSWFSAAGPVVICGLQCLLAHRCRQLGNTTHSLHPWLFACRSGHQLVLNGRPWYFVGYNAFWFIDAASWGREHGRRQIVETLQGARVRALCGCVGAWVWVGGCGWVRVGLEVCGVGGLRVSARPPCQLRFNVLTSIRYALADTPLTCCLAWQPAAETRHARGAHVGVQHPAALCARPLRRGAV